MATQERLLKSLDYLRNRTTDQTLDNAKKKERMQHCYVIAEAICNSTIKVATSFHSYLALTIELLLQLCDDSESDVRMTAEECLNRIIRALSDANIGKVQIELHKCIKRNGAARSLRAALTRFAQLVHFIRPNKGKPYVVNLFPALAKITQRQEEQLHETLANSLQPIMNVLGGFASDSETKELLKAFLKNVSNESAAIRRSAATAIVNICQSGRTPDSYFEYVVSLVLGLNFDDFGKKNLLGALFCLKLVLPRCNLREGDKTLDLKWLLQIYDLCLSCLSKKDHNVINAALETLNVLLQLENAKFRSILLTENGLEKVDSNLVRSPSQCSIATNLTLNEEGRESELVDTLRSDIEKWIGESQLTIINAKTAPRAQCEPIEKSFSIESYEYGSLHANDEFERVLSRQSSRNSSEKSFSCIESTNGEPMPEPVFAKSGVALHYCARLVARFLLADGGVSNDKVRVSTKSLALSCIAAIVQIAAEVLGLVFERSQGLAEVLFYEDHLDPQLRGLVRLVLANFVRKVLASGDYSVWVREKCHNMDQLLVESVIRILVKGLKDESSTCSRQTLISLNYCLVELIQSVNHKYVLDIMETLPSLAHNPYWLVKVSLCELIAKLSYVEIFYATKSNRFQNQIITNVLLQLLLEDDARVRNAAAIALVNIIPNLHYESYKHQERIVTIKAISEADKYFTNLYDCPTSGPCLEGAPFPFSCLYDRKSDRVEFGLAKLLGLLGNVLLKSASKTAVMGCFEVLHLLANAYPTTLYSTGWNCEVKTDFRLVSFDLFNKCVHYLVDSIYVHDLSCHFYLLSLTSNLFAGFAMCFLKSNQESDESDQSWSIFNNSSFSHLTDLYLGHILKILNIFYHILDELTPHPPPVKVLPNLSASSPLKRRKSDLEKKIIPIKLTDEKDKKEPTKSTASTFIHLPHYTKIYEILRSAYTNYKTSLQPESSEKLLELLKQTLHSFAILMDIGGLNEFQGYADEILTYLRSTFLFEAIGSVECVQQLLKCLFGTNLASNVVELQRHVIPQSQMVASGFYYQIYQKPYERLTSFISSVKQTPSTDFDDATIMGYLHRKESKVVVSTRCSEQILANYIRLFEPVVIKSLKLYTITSDVKLQCRVLQLLNHLIQLRVNYCLLDSEQIFIGFVLKQFEFIEEGQIPCADELIKHIFQFLVQLTHSKQHSKSIITIPKIIQLCDGLMASGQSSLTHCIPALQPIVDNIFLAGNKPLDPKELETTREVILSTLLKLSKHQQVLNLIVFILNDSRYCTTHPEKWERWSEQVANVVLTQLMQDKFTLTCFEEVGSLRQLFFALEPNILKQIDPFILLLFKGLPNGDLRTWLGKIIVCLLVFATVKEELLLRRIDELRGRLSPDCIFENFKLIADPLNVQSSIDNFHGLEPETIFVRFLFKSLKQLTCELIQNWDEFLAEGLGVLLMYSIYMFQSGGHCKLTKSAICNIKTINIDELNANFLQLAATSPLVAFLWCYFLTVLNYKDTTFWKLATSRTGCINYEVVTVGSVISFCNYLAEDVLEPNQIAWFLDLSTHLIVELCDEVPVAEFISTLHRNAITSQMFLSSIAQLNLETESVFLLKMLKCVEKTHTLFTGNLLKLLLPKLLLLRDLTVCRSVAKLTSRKVELLLTMSMEEVHEQLGKEDVISMIKTMSQLKLVQKYEVLASLLNKLCFQYYDASPLDFDRKQTVNSAYIRKLTINREWYLKQVGQICDSRLSKESVKLLYCLEESEILSFVKKCDLGLCLRTVQGESECILVKVIVSSLLQEVHKVSGCFLQQFVFKPFGRNPTDSELQFAKSFEDFINSDSNLTQVINLIPAITSLMENFSHLISGTDRDDLVTFGVLILNLLNHLIDTNKPTVNLIDSILKCTNRIFCESFTQTILSADETANSLCSSINSLFKLVEHLLQNDEPLPCLPNWGLETSSEAVTSYGCHQLYILLTWLINSKSVPLPRFLCKSIFDLIVSFSRFSITNSYMLVPVQVWRGGWAPQLGGALQTQVGLIPIELLQDGDVLEEYIYRVLLLGWTNWQQFEETWMCFLSVLCGNGEGNESAASLAVRAITSLLLHTFNRPDFGFKQTSTIIHIARNPVEVNRNHLGLVKLKMIHDLIEGKQKQLGYLPEVVNVFKLGNFEKLDRNGYAYGQVSVRYLMVATQTLHDDESEAERSFLQREKLLEMNGLDINSCLQFLLDFYAQLLKAPIISLKLLHEAVRSIVIISDLFTDKNQFSWLLSTCINLAKTHIVDDELLHQYLIVGMSKAVAVLNPELEVYESTKKILVQYLKSSLLPTRIACLHGLLYILEGSRLSNITIGGISDEMQIILPCAVEYVLCNITTTNSTLKSSQDHTMLVWSLAFYLMENVDEMHMEVNFITNTLNVAFNILNESTLSITFHTALIKGLEKLMIVKNERVLRQHKNQIANLAVEKLKNENPCIAMLGLQLLVTFMYTDCKEYVAKSRTLEEETNPDDLVQTIEKISAIFEHMKRGFGFEVEILSFILPNILNDFFSPANILTKVIGEFLSPQQSHPKLLSGVVFKVFEKAIEDKQLPLLQDWVVFSLSNITQSLSLGMKTWCLTCFFISASSNVWLRLLFPYVQTRVGRYEFEDRQLLCIAGANFYNSLSTDKQKQTFIDNFNKIKNQPDTLFNDLLSCL